MKQRYTVTAWDFGEETSKGVRMLRVGYRVIRAKNLLGACRAAQRLIKNRDCYAVSHGEKVTRFYPHGVLGKCASRGAAK